MDMWEILVPKHTNAGRRIKLKQHQDWDSKVRDITGGMTILKPARGHWIDSHGTHHEEYMIPVRIMCHENNMEVIAKMTLEHYEQLSVMYYRISDYVRVIKKDEEE